MTGEIIQVPSASRCVRTQPKFIEATPHWLLSWRKPPGVEWDTFSLVQVEGMVVESVTGEPLGDIVDEDTECVQYTDVLQATSPLRRGYRDVEAKYYCYFVIPGCAFAYLQAWEAVKIREKAIKQLTKEAFKNG